jgi:nucleoporin SEH1
VTRIAWAHPEFGSILGTCSNDKSIQIFEERKSQNEKELWSKVYRLFENKLKFEDLKFGPKSLGLLFAAASS